MKRRSQKWPRCIAISKKGGRPLEAASEVVASLSELQRTIFVITIEAESLWLSRPPAPGGGRPHIEDPEETAVLARLRDAHALEEAAAMGSNPAWRPRHFGTANLGISRLLTQGRRDRKPNNAHNLSEIITGLETLIPQSFLKIFRRCASLAVGRSGHVAAGRSIKSG